MFDIKHNLSFNSIEHLNLEIPTQQLLESYNRWVSMFAKKCFIVFAWLKSYVWNNCKHSCRAN